ncbi:MAG: class I SAM-dependent methyltransferase, partial [Actinomycetota bacterium]
MEPVRDAYSALAEKYIELFATTEAGHPEDLALIARHLAIPSGVVLDVGCGPGHLTDHLRSLGADAVGFDLVPTFIDHARRTYPDGRYGFGSATNLPVPDGVIAGLLSWYSLIHLPPADLDGVLAELRRVMAPNGRLVIGFFDGPELGSFEHKVITASFLPADWVAERLQRA